MNNSLQTIALSASNLESYLHSIHQIPVLSAEKEKELAERYIHHNDLNAVRQLILANLRFVAYIANSYKGYHLPQADIIQEGNIGLMKAIKKFDPSVGVRLITFAVYWIKSEINEYVLKNWRMVKVATTKAQRKLFFNLKKYKKSLNWLTQDEAKHIAQDLGVSPQEVTEMEQRLENYEQALEYHDASDDKSYQNPINYLEAPNTQPEVMLEAEDKEQQFKQVLQAVSQLDDRSQDILNKRYFSEQKATLHDLAAEYHISAERVRQLENAAIKKLKGLMT